VQLTKGEAQIIHEHAGTPLLSRAILQPKVRTIQIGLSTGVRDLPLIFLTVQNQNLCPESNREASDLHNHPLLLTVKVKILSSSPWPWYGPRLTRNQACSNLIAHPAASKEYLH
jgi:hypothetical protein